jgi:TetR/AcrR family transcriptional repressor of nem operon
MAGGLKSQIERLAALMPGTDESARRQAAIGGWSAMVGAVIMARAVEDPAFSDEILKETRAWLHSATASDERSAS